MKFKELLAKVKSEHPKGKPLRPDGSELPDPVPMAPPVGYRKEPSMFEVIRELVAAEKLRVKELEEFESPDEADDFDVEDDYEPHSPWEHNFDHVADPGELKRLRDAIDLRERQLRGDDIRPAASASEGSVGNPAGGPASSSGPGKPAATDGK